MAAVPVFLFFLCIVAVFEAILHHSHGKADHAEGSGGHTDIEPGIVLHHRQPLGAAVIQHSADAHHTPCNDQHSQDGAAAADGFKGEFFHSVLSLFQLECAGVKLIVGALLGDQIIVGATFNDASVIQHHDAVGIFNSGQTVGNDKDGTTCHQLIHAILHQLFGTGIDGGGGLVQDHHRGIGHSCTGDGDQLPLSLGKAGAVAGQLGVVTLGQASDEVVGICQLGSFDAILVGGVQSAVTDVVHYCAGEQVGFLQHHAQAAPQIGLFDLVDIDAVIADLAVCNVVEAVDQVGDGGLAGTGSANKGDFLTGVGIERYIMKHLLFGHIAKIHVVHGDVAL